MKAPWSETEPPLPSHPSADGKFLVIKERIKDGPMIGWRETDPHLLIFSNRRAADGWFVGAKWVRPVFHRLSGTFICTIIEEYGSILHWADEFLCSALLHHPVTIFWLIPFHTFQSVTCSHS